jgi:hypothetical protein
MFADLKATGIVARGCIFEERGDTMPFVIGAPRLLRDLFGAPDDARRVYCPYDVPEAVARCSREGRDPSALPTMVAGAVGMRVRVLLVGGV